LADERDRVATNGRPSINKRNREQARRDRNLAKIERRAERAAQRRDRAASSDGEDPDLIGIVPGPQPPLED
jgi:hypothetical protein